MARCLSWNKLKYIFSCQPRSSSRSTHKTSKLFCQIQTRKFSPASLFVIHDLFCRMWLVVVFMLICSKPYRMHDYYGHTINSDAVKILKNGHVLLSLRNFRHCIRTLVTCNHTQWLYTLTQTCFMLAKVNN